MIQEFHNLNSLKLWAHSNEVKFIGQDKSLPYILKDGQYHYFAKDTQGFKLLEDGRTITFIDKSFVLVMTSSKDIGAQA